MNRHRKPRRTLLLEIRTCKDGIVRYYERLCCLDTQTVLFYRRVGRVQAMRDALSMSVYALSHGLVIMKAIL
jgi:hypothetical protein